MFVLYCQWEWNLFPASRLEQNVTSNADQFRPFGARFGPRVITFCVVITSVGKRDHRTNEISFILWRGRAAYQHRLHDRRRSGDYRRQCSIRFHNSFVVSRILSTGPSLVVTGSLRYSFNSNKLRGSLIFFYLHLGATDSCMRKFV